MENSIKKLITEKVASEKSILLEAIRKFENNTGLSVDSIVTIKGESGDFLSHSPWVIDGIEIKFTV